MSYNRIVTWDFTVPKVHKDRETSHTEIIEWMKTHCKKWGFQLEKGKETGYMHFQCRVKMNDKTKTLPESVFHKGNSKPTSAKGALLTNFYNYTTKEDTKVDGPWLDTDIEKTLTHQLKLFKEFEKRPYQLKILGWCQVFDMRSIDIIYDNVGNIGKSLFTEWMEYEGLVEEVPPFRNMEDIFQWVFGMPKKKAYFFDMPRGMKKDKLGEFYAGIEVIKNGVAYDKRYQAKKVRFDRPRIFIFTNTLPDFELMSKDRWNVWRVTSDYDLDTLSICS